MNLKDTYNKIAELWHKDHSSDDWWVGGTDAFVSYLKTGCNVLDVGCGGGTKSKYLIGKGLNVIGIDFSENLLSIAKRECPQGRFLVMDINNIDALEEKFDGILKKAVSKLNDGGYLYIAVKEKIEGGIDEETKTDNDYGYEYERFFSYFSLDDFKKYFKKIGLEMVYENVMPPSRTTRQSNWMQVIGKKL